MNKLIISLFVVLAVTFTMNTFVDTSTMSGSMQVYAENEQYMDIKINATNVNVLFEVSDVSSVSADYNTDKFDVDISKDDMGYEITVTNNRTSNLTITEMITIYLPDEDYGMFTVSGMNAGIALPSVNANFDITSVNSAVSIDIPENYNKILNASLVNSAGSINISETFTDYTFNAQALMSATNLPDAWQHQANRNGLVTTYSYTNGTGVAQFNLDIQTSAFSFSEIDWTLVDISTMHGNTQVYTDNEQHMDIKINATNVNVLFEVSDVSSVSADYNSDKFDVDISKDDMGYEITVTNNRTSNLTITDIVTIYLPNEDYGMFTVSGTNSGIALPSVNANFDITSVNSAISMDIPESYNKILNASLVNSAGSINILENFTDYTFNAQASMSAISLPDAWQHRLNRNGLVTTYSYTNGTGVAQFNLDIQTSAFSFSEID